MTPDEEHPTGNLSDTTNTPEFEPHPEWAGEMVRKYRSLEDVLKPEHIEDYRKLHSDIWKRLIRLHMTIIILEYIEKFPFHLFVPRNEMVFWTMVDWNFYGMAIVRAHALVADTGGDCLTLPRFRNCLTKKWIKPEERESYRDLLKGCKFGHQIEMIRGRVIEIRNSFEAHRLLDPVTQRPVTGAEVVTLSELRAMYEAMENLFDVCSIEAKCLTTLGGYCGEMVGGNPVQTDIEQLLDLIARNSHFIRKPEEPWWPAVREGMPKQNLDVLNHYRKKFGMNEA